MLLGNRHLKATTIIAVGELSLVAALVGARFVHPPTDFWQGFVAGVCGALLGVSIVFNLYGLVRVGRGALRGD